MMQRIARWLGPLLLCVSAAVSAQQGYTTLSTPQPTLNQGEVEVREFFSYACPACAMFEPRLDAWMKQAPEQVRLVHVPVVFNEAWKPYAQAYYAAEALGVLDRIHRPLFDAIHGDKRQFKSSKDLVGFFVERGVPKEQAEAAFNSFRVDMQLRQGAQALRNYRIESTPTVVVAGKYVVTPRTAGSHEQMISVIDRLVRQEIAAKK
jgi:thiol:disulfide interchange protein DsbA